MLDEILQCLSAGCDIGLREGRVWVIMRGTLTTLVAYASDALEASMEIITS